jgi:uncharacterized protein YdhG (YjbR/CyaY superfamily)
MQAKASTIPECIAGLPAKERAVIETLGKIVRSALPEATAAMRYGMPTFESAGRLVAFNSPKNYFAFYADPKIVKGFAAELAAYDVGKSCIRFRTLDPALMATLEKIVAEYRK